MRLANPACEAFTSPFAININGLNHVRFRCHNLMYPR